MRGLVIRPRGGDVHAVDERHVRADAAVTINGLVRWTILHGLAGLEAWAGTPGTVGGAIFGNAHFGGRLIGDLVDRGAAGQPRRRWCRTFRRRRWRSATIAAACRTAARCCCRPPSRCRAASPRRCARRRGSRWRSGSGRSRSTRRAPAASSRIRSRDATACRTASRGRPARWSIGPGSKASRSAARASRRPTATSSSTTGTPRPPRSGR